MNSDQIILNIGGIKYHTTKDTLLSISGEETFFSGLLSDDWHNYRDKENEIPVYFIDRNGKYFEPILEFLRTTEVFIPKDMPIYPVFREALFYSINMEDKALDQGIIKDILFISTYKRDSFVIISNSTKLMPINCEHRKFSDKIIYYISLSKFIKEMSKNPECRLISRNSNYSVKFRIFF